MLRSRERHIEQAFHFLPLCVFDFLLQFGGNIGTIENDLRSVRLDRFNRTRITDRRAPNFSRKKWHNDCLPFRAFRFVRSDQLNRIGERRARLARFAKIRSQVIREFC